MTQDYQISLEVFEGPLDLLLHLVKKHELDIFDIPVAFVTEKYLAYLELMRSLNLDVAGEYLLMAATLVHIKSRELLPSPDPAQADQALDPDEEELDPRQELIARLLEYQKYREAARELGDRPVIGRNVWLRGSPVEAAPQDNPQGSLDAPLCEVPVFKLLEALADVLGRARINLAHEVTVERLSISERINELAARLEVEGSFTFAECFDIRGAGDTADSELSLADLKQHVVITFLAILEMARLKLIRILQPEGLSEIVISSTGGDVQKRSAQAVSTLSTTDSAGSHPCQK